MTSLNELSSTQSQVRLRLTTRETGITLDDTAPILVPTTFRRYQLSTLVNGLLEKEKIVPLEFLINGTYLRTSLEEYLTANGISAETTLTVEYVRARLPPQYVASFEHDDWISDVDVLSPLSTAAKSSSKRSDAVQTRVLTSSYDGRLRVWNTSSQVLATSPALADGGHASFVKSAKFISPTEIVSASFDRSVRVWKYLDGEDGDMGIMPKLELYGHQAGVESICAHAPSRKLLSASSDHRVGLWSIREKDAPPALDSLIPKSITKDGKRRKLNMSVTIPRRGPLALLQAHTAPVTAAVFDLKDPSVGYSVSQDHTIRTWDLVTSALVDTRSTNSVLFCIEQMPDLHLLACGSASRDVKLVDPRTSATTVTAITLKGHRNHVVTLARDPISEYSLLSGSHDGTCRVWDIRSTNNSKDGITGQSTYTISRNSLNGRAAPSTGEGVKVFGVCWNQDLGILSAGEDKAVQINSSSSVS